MTNSADTYTQLEATLALATIELTPSEVHGTVVGAISNHMKSGISPDLLKLIEPQAQADDPHYAQLSQVLYELYRDNSDTLLGGNDSFELVLPDDDDALDARVEGIANWSRGYLLGLLYNNAFSVDQMPESGAEITRDFIQIAEAGAGAEAEQEEDWALAELQEYVKVGVQLIFESIYSERASQAPEQQQ